MKALFIASVSLLCIACSSNDGRTTSNNNATDSSTTISDSTTSVPEISVPEVDSAVSIRDLGTEPSDVSPTVDADVPVMLDFSTPDLVDTVVVPPKPRNGWRLTFADEFSGPESADDPCYDNAKTKPMCLNRYWSREPCDASNKELMEKLKGLNKCVWSVYNIYNWMDWGKPFGFGFTALDPNEVRVDTEKGELILTSTKVGGTAFDCGRDIDDHLITKNCQIRSGAIMSKSWDGTAGFQQTYGRFEVRAILPGGHGSWPAHWLLPEKGGWPNAGEIDIMEYVWGRPDDVHGTFHGGTYDPDTKVRTHHSRGHHHATGDDRFFTRWHVYAVEWNADEIRFYVDDLEIGRLRQGEMLETEVLTDNNKKIGKLPVDIPDILFHFILNTSVVPTGKLKKDLSNFKTLVHRIDYVRVYERCMTNEPKCMALPPRSKLITQQRWMSKAKWSAQYRKTHVGDFNGDGRDDLLLQTKFDEHATYLLLAVDGNRLGTENAITTKFGMTAALWSDKEHVLHVLDVNGDGADDVLLQPRGSGKPTLLISDKKGGFSKLAISSTSTLDLPSNAWNAGVYRLLPIDVNGDKRADLLFLPLSSKDSARLVIQKASGGFDKAVAIGVLYQTKLADWAVDTHHGIVGDFNGDKKQDLLLQPNTDDYKPILLLGSATGFSDKIQLSGQFGVASSHFALARRQLHIGDFNGDGRDDVLLQAKPGSEHSFMLLSGNTLFNNLFQISFKYSMQRTDWLTAVLRVGDFDNDKRSDVLLKHSDGRMFVLKGTSDGLSKRVDVTDRHVMSKLVWSESLRDYYIGDFNGDGRSDVFGQTKTDQHDTYLIFLIPE